MAEDIELKEKSSEGQEKPSVKQLFARKKKDKEVIKGIPWREKTPIQKLECVMKYFSYVYVCFIWANTVEYFCFGQTSVRMSYFGYIWWYVFVLGLLGAIYGGRTHRRGVGIRGTMGSVLTMIMFAFIVYGSDISRIIMAPAHFIKQVGLGFRAGFRFIWDPEVMQWVFLAFFIIGLLIIIVYELVHPGPRPVYEDEEEERRVIYQRRVKWIGFAILFCGVMVCCFVQPVRDTIGYVFDLLSKGDIELVKQMIRDAGPWAVAFTTFLMVFQALAAPIPAFLITFSNAAVFGAFWGCVISWSSAMLAAAICFWIARFFGRDAVMLFMSRGALAAVDRWFTTYGKNTILICRLLPFVSFDYISYAAGITGMSFLDFFIWTGIGQLPATIVYSWVGSTLTGQMAEIFTGMCVLFVAFGIMFFLREVWKNRHKALMDESNETADKEIAEQGASQVEVNAKGILHSKDV